MSDHIKPLDFRLSATLDGYTPPDMDPFTCSPVIEVRSIIDEPDRVRIYLYSEDGKTSAMGTFDTRTIVDMFSKFYTGGGW